MCIRDSFTDFAGVPEWVHKNNAGMMMMAWGADWPTGFGFLDQIVNGSAIKPSGGTNLMELDDKAINELLVKGIGTVDTTARNATWGEVDQKVMENASVVPLFYRKNLLPPGLRGERHGHGRVPRHVRLRADDVHQVTPVHRQHPLKGR